MLESDLAAPATAYLRDLGYDVFHEVEFAGRRADLVGIQKRPSGATIIHVVELKVSLGLPVLDQAMRWRGFAHFVTVGVPHARKLGLGPSGRVICDHWGVGVVRLYQAANDAAYISEHYREEHAPRLNRRIPDNFVRRWLGGCVPETAAGSAVLAAGSKGGGYWTPFRATLHAIEDFLKDRRHPDRADGVPMKTMIDGIRHHYANSQSARGALGALGKWIDRGKLPGVETFIKDRKLFIRLSPNNAKANS